MIPANFAYHSPSTVEEAVGLLARLGDEARALAGGHSLIPMMKLRLSAPEALVDLSRIAALKGVREEGSEVVIGAMTTQHQLLQDPILAQTLPLIPETSAVIADPQIRYRGTLGGNVANGDPGNDMPAVMMTLDATYTLAGPNGERAVKAREFYQGAYFTAAEDGEILTAVRIPVPPAGAGFAYEKLKRKVGDYATAAAAVQLTMKAGAVETIAIGLTNVSETPLLAEDAMAILAGARLEPEVVDRAVAAAEAITNPASDGRGPAEYRTAMAGVMLRRALARAAARAQA
ncbi:FAD binding domain-containing protein [Salinarimonas rosea]|uniref:FAD binding domain-containing protein n=1 Tax=Salinarimonas rosea TaxID=552063 RepID=UPI00041DA882|nr:xanthine dehydrogenase family protein subunit M [Salinarimonas rosea]